MLVEKIRLLNFGPFRGEHELVFPGHGGGVHLLRGENGQGKTSLQRAILWCLFFKIFDRKGQEIRPTSLLNRGAVADDIFQCAVILYFNHEGKDWIISRKMEAKSHADKAYTAGMKVSIVCDGDPLPNPEHAIQRIIPEDVSRFFFFDGEMLRDYEELLDQNSHSMALLRDSIEHVLGIPYLKTARDDLQEVQRKFEAERNKVIRKLGGKEYDQIVEDFQMISAEISEREKTIKGLEKQIQVLEVEIADDKRKSADYDAVRKLAKERIEIDSTIKVLKAKREKVLGDLRTGISEVYKTIVIQSSEAVIAQLEAKHDKTMKRYNEKQSLTGQAQEIQRAISASKCRLCGTVLDASKITGLQGQLSEVKAKIRELTDVPEPNLEYEHHVNRLRTLREKMVAREKLVELDEKISNDNHSIATQTARLATVTEKIGTTDDSEAQKIEAKIRSAMLELGRLSGLLDAEKVSLRGDLEVKAELDQRMRTIDEEELSIIARRIEMAMGLAEVLEQAVSEFRNERRTFVGSIASEIFRKIRSKTSFSGLSINSQFGLNVVTDTGVTLDRAEWRSSGEEQLVALALMGALNKCAKIQAPIFMDTPFGRLDTGHGEKVLRFLPSLSTQVVLLVTDREFRPGDEEFLEGQIRSDHTLIHRGEKEGTTISLTKSVEVVE